MDERCDFSTEGNRTYSVFSWNLGRENKKWMQDEVPQVQFQTKRRWFAAIAVFTDQNMSQSEAKI